jgi:hypothetical protein
MYLVLSAFTSSPISFLAATKASAFTFTIYKPEADVHHLISSHPGLPEPA